MIDLDIQIKLIVFSFIFGFFFSLLLEIFNEKVKKCKSILKFFLSLVVVIFSTLVYFEGIKKIGNAILHIYSILTIILGFICYDLLIRLIANNSKK